jgi:hypothetical protein
MRLIMASLMVFVYPCAFPGSLVVVAAVVVVVAVRAVVAARVVNVPG